MLVQTLTVHVDVHLQNALADYGYEFINGNLEMDLKTYTELVTCINELENGVYIEHMQTQMYEGHTHIFFNVR